MKLSDTLKKTIADFCKNQFTGSDQNHCAHFVCHVLELDLGYTCKIHTSGRHAGVCIRVQDLFAHCPKVGYWGDAPGGMKMVFVTDKSNVDLAKHTMRNVPKKHVGIFSESYIYHYANKDDIVIRQTPEDFLVRFQKAYGGDQALFFGTMPVSAKIPDAENKDTHVAALLEDFEPELHVTLPAIRRETVSPDKYDYFATLPEVKEYYIARSTKFKALCGLWQPGNKLYGPRYAGADFADEYETVAGMLDVISAGESSGYFNRLNTYDRASFTFGFCQLAAHTPNDNLVMLFRRAVAESTTFQALFPDLKIVDGVLHRNIGSHTVSLENLYPRPSQPNDKNLKDFMTYLNADGAIIDDTELSVAARLVHIANTDEAFNRLQVSVAAQITMRKIKNAYSDWYDLNGVSDLICAAIADIHHQGRGSKTEVKKALLSANTLNGKVNALCKVGEAIDAQRCATLKKSLTKAKGDGLLGISVFEKASGVFRPNQGWLV